MVQRSTKVERRKGPWAQLAKNAKQWTKLRNEYAEDWPSNQRTDTYHKKNEKVTNHRDQKHDQNGPLPQNPFEVAEDKESIKIVPIDSVQQDKGDDTYTHKGSPHSKFIPLPGKRKRITIMMNSSRPAVQAKDIKH